MALPLVHPTVVHMLQGAAERSPEREALVCEGERLSYREYLACVAGFAQGLIDLGAAGERVALVLGNSIDVCIAMFGAHAARAQVVPLNPFYTERELKQILEDAAPRVIVYDQDSRAVVERVTASVDIPHRLYVAPDGRRLSARRDGPALLPQPLPAPDDLATLQYTGGTTGRAKGVNLSHRAVATNISQREALLPARPDQERLLCVMPLFHVYAVAMCLHNMAHCRGTLVILPRYSADDVLKAMEEEGITIFAGSPTLFTGLMNHEAFASTDFSRLFLSYSGASALPEPLLRRWEAATGAPALEGFGQSEAGPVISFNPLHGVRKPSSVGVALPHTEIQIVDVADGTRVLPPGEQGEIRVRGPQIMSGYRNLPDETAQTLRDGWLYTGDIGELDEEGYLYIRDRKKEMVKVSGFNVFPREVEDVLYQHPAVLEAAVIGVPDAYKGEAVTAFVALRPGAQASAEDLAEHCRASLARYKVPSVIQFVESLPKTRVGKVDKIQLRTAGQ